MKLNPYPAYKPSGADGSTTLTASWLGDVPEHWAVKRGRFAMRVNPPCPRFKALKPTDEVSFVPMEAVGILGGLNLDQAREIADISSGYTQFQDGDVIVAKITPCFENGKGALASGLQNGAACGTTELHVLRAMETLDRRFLFFLSISDVFRKRGEAEMYGAGGQKRIPPEFNKDFRTPLPPPAEQRAIADFLDRETKKIDRLVAKKRELIGKLKEERTALISRAVTRGLNAEAAFKPSGVEWLGNVPEHWEVKRGLFAMHVNPPCPRFRALEPTDEVSFVPMEAVGIMGGLNLEQTREIADISSGYTQFQDGDVIVAKITPCFENGKGALAAGLQNGAACGTTELHVLRAMETLDRRFLFFLSISDVFRKRGEAEMYGAGGQKRIPPEFNKDFRTPLPPPAEQRAIADFLDRETIKIDRLAAKVEEAIARLQEYRAALITAAVTGKIDVRASAGMSKPLAYPQPQPELRMVAEGGPEYAPQQQPRLAQNKRRRTENGTP